MYLFDGVGRFFGRGNLPNLSLRLYCRAAYILACILP
jgi:hypothetical protein